ncbi:MAG: BREX system P-loop protein BrxC [Deltaproteobacteria bacterium]|nr:BREX system P-loop protein BrxC [Deltaproteobacteria bacterium]
MNIGEIFETPVEQKIDPVIKVGDLHDEDRLAGEIGCYVVTPFIEKCIDDFLDHYTDTLRKDTEEIGVWVSGYFGSGKSHLSKILGLLVENRTLKGVSAAKRFEARIPADATRRASILRNLGQIPACESKVLAFNLNTLVDSPTTPLARLLLAQYYQHKGYSPNVLYAGVVERELDRLGKLAQLHSEAAKRSGHPWADIQKNPGFYAKALYAAASAVAPEAFPKPEDVGVALQRAEKGELINVDRLVSTVLEDLDSKIKETKKPCRLVFVLDESGQWIGDNQDRLAQLQALVEIAAIRGRGRIWLTVTTHEDMGTVLQTARQLKSDMKKIEDRFRFKFSLTTENIERVLEDRVLKKKIAGADAVKAVYDSARGVIRSLGELSGIERALPECDEERFGQFYPFFPYQIWLIPEIVKSLRAKGGRAEQLSGSTRTLLAITQDILRAGRRPYPKLPVGEMVSFDEIYYNLSGEGEVSPDIRRELSQIEKVVSGATALTRRIAESLFLIDELRYIPRTADNLARFLVESSTDDLAAIRRKIDPELQRLIKARIVAKVGEEYEFLTGERRSFEEEVDAAAGELRQHDREAGFARYFVYDSSTRGAPLLDVLGFSTVSFQGKEFNVQLAMDETVAAKSGHVRVFIHSPLAVLAGLKLSDLENRSLRDEEKNTIFVLCDRVPLFDQDLNRFLAMRDVIDRWKGDQYKPDVARKLALDRESNDLSKLENALRKTLRESLQRGHIIFRGASRSLLPKPGETAGAMLRGEIAAYFPTIYPNYKKVPVRLSEEQKAIRAILIGDKSLPPEVEQLDILDKSRTLKANAPLIEAIRISLAAKQGRSQRTLGRDLLDEFSSPPYGWDPNAVRAGVAACVRAGRIKLRQGKATYTNPADSELQRILTNSLEFNRSELVLEDTEIPQEVLERARNILVKLTNDRRIEETPAAIHQAFEKFANEKLSEAKKVTEWAEPAHFLAPDDFNIGCEALGEILALTSPHHRIPEIEARREVLDKGLAAIELLWNFYNSSKSVFVQVRELADDLHAAEAFLPASPAISAFLETFEQARTGARFADPSVWKSVHSAYSAARLELDSLLEERRQEARTSLDSAMKRVGDSASVGGLDSDQIAAVLKPLESIRSLLDQEIEPGRLITLPDLVRTRGRECEGKLTQTLREKAGRNGQQPLHERQIRHVRLSDVVSTRTVHSPEDWERISRELDQHVLALLADFDVELE